MSKRNVVSTSTPARIHGHRSMRSLVQFTVLLGGIFALSWFIMNQTDGNFDATPVRARTIDSTNSGPTPRLQAIFHGDDGQGLAVINRQTVAVGAQIGGYTVAAIYPQSVVLKSATGGIITLRLPNPAR